MPNFQIRTPDYKPAKATDINWNTFRKGLNTLLQDTEIDKQELAQAKNIVLVGAGVPTKRWGSRQFFQSGNATGSVRGLKAFYLSNGTIETIALTDDGYLTKMNGASYSTLTGVSWASGNNAQMAQLDDNLYIVNGQRELARYSSPTLVGFPTIALPVVTGATNISNATGATVKGYRVTAVSTVGETLASSTFELKSQPDNLGGTAGGVLRLFITPPSTASGILTGMNIYGRNSGNERFISFLPGNATIYDDNGAAIPKEFTYPPTADSTGGPNAKYVTRFQDRLVFAGMVNEPSKVLVSGRVPNHEKFDLANGGNFIKVEPDAGDDVVGVQGFADRVVAFKERSIWQITLSTEQVGNFFVTQPSLKLVTASNGCIAPRTVVPVENDVYYLDRRGVFSLGYQANFSFDTLRSNEISIKIRPYFENLTESQLKDAVAIYFKGKYIISFPSRGESMVFDRERLAWTGPWTIDPTVFEVLHDEGDNPNALLYAQEGSVFVKELTASLTDDDGDPIETILRTRSEDFGSWTLFKNIRNVFTQMRSVTGSVSVDIRIETRTGNVLTQKSFNITPTSGNSGWGSNLWADALWGDTEVSAGGVEAIYTIRWAKLNKVGRTMQLTIKTTDINSNYELLAIAAEARPVGAGARPSSWKV